MTNSTKYNTPEPECCADLKCESGLRNNYFEGKRLTVDSFRVEQDYSLQRRRLLNRAIHGWGVVYGYEVIAGHSGQETRAGRLTIGPGLALDACGRELLQAETLIALGDVILLNHEGKIKDDRGKPFDLEKTFAKVEQHNRLNPADERCWLLSVHYAEKDTSRMPVEDPCRCKHYEWNHTCETVRFSLRPIGCAKCCDEFKCELSCKCESGPCGDRYSNPEDARTAMPQQRGRHQCLCDHLTQLKPGAECGSLCTIEDSCGTVRVDVRNSVPLACIGLVRDDDCDRITFGEVREACAPRRLVKRNDLLYDLIRGCDLTRISEIGWEGWHRREDLIPFQEFARAFGTDGHGRYEPGQPGFWLKFSRPVRKDSLRTDCFAMTVSSEERDDGWWETLRVPIVDVGTVSERGDPEGYVRAAVIVVDRHWAKEIQGDGKHLFRRSETRVELEVRGDFIIDCNGQTVDANPIGLSPFPTGNGTPGGTFLSTFRVARAPEASARTGRDDIGNQLSGFSGNQLRGVSS